MNSPDTLAGRVIARPTSDDHCGSGTQIPPALPLSATPWLLFTERQRWGFLAILFLSATSCFFDKNVISVLLEPIKQEFQVSDTMLGLLSGFSFALFYTVAGFPAARWADRGNRRTIITLAISAWSVMTAICGLAQTFGQLLLSRIGVGVGESGAVPPAHSLIADYFPPERRALAIGIYTAAGTAGVLLGIGLGGYIAATYGWRAAFLLAGLPGLLLAVIIRFTLAEPRLQLGFPNDGARGESLSATATTLWRKRSFVYALAGCILYTFMVQGAFIFVPSFLVRVLNLPLGRASLTYGGIAAAASLIGTLVGGWSADRLRLRDIRWLTWLPSVACILAGPLQLLAFSVNDVRLFMILAFAVQVLATGALPSIFAAIHAVCGASRRAVAIAVVYFVSALVGNGLGPLITGAISDALRPTYGPDGLRYSLMTVTFVLMAAGLVFYKGGQTISKDLEDSHLPVKDRS